MTQTVARGTATVATLDIVQCSTCGRIIGQYQQVGKQVCLNIGGLIVNSAHGTCLCGAEFHWRSSDKLLENLIRRCKEKSPLAY